MLNQKVIIRTNIHIKILNELKLIGVKKKSDNNFSSWMSDEENKESPPPSKETNPSDGEETNKNSEPSSISLHVGNLKYETTEETLKNVFGEIGPVVRVELIKKDDGSSKGYAFVDMENKKDADDAIEKLNKTDLEGRIITVAFKKTREELQNDRIRNRRSAPFYDRSPGGRRGRSYYRDDRDDRYDDYHRRYRDSRRSSRDHYHDYDRDRDRRRGSRRSFDYDYDSFSRRSRSRSRSPRSSRRNYSDSD